MADSGCAGVDALILAGGINKVELFPGYRPGYKALLDVAGRPAISYTVAALVDSGRVGRICVVGSEDDLRDAAAGATEFVAGGATLMDSIAAGLGRFHDSRAVLIATADLPLLSAGSVSGFLDAAAALDVDYPNNLWLSVVPESCYTGPYQGFSKGFNRFRDVAVCHGNVALVDPRLISNTDAMARINRLYSSRKNPLSAALAIGWKVGLSYIVGVHLLHMLTLQQMSAIASHRFQVGLIPVLVSDPAVAIDVDEPGDYEFVTRRLAVLAAERGLSRPPNIPEQDGSEQ